jgi:hypothetical protein
MHPHVNSGLVMALTESSPTPLHRPLEVSEKVQKCGRTYLVKHNVVILINFLFFHTFSLRATVFLAHEHAK